MSAYVHVPMAMIDQECLIEALVNCGISKEMIRINNTAEKLVDYHGYNRVDEAEIVIPRQYIGMSSNDIGFKSTPAGYTAIISEYDSGRFNTQWRMNLARSYERAYSLKVARLEAEKKKRDMEELARLEEAKRVAREEINRNIQEKAKKLGYTVKESREGSTIQLVLVKRSY